MKLVKAIAAACALVLTCGPAAAQVPDPHARELARKLAQADATMSEQGYSRAAGPFAGGLGVRETRRFSVTLRAGQEYSVVGVCDARCDDLGLALSNSRNTLVAQVPRRDGDPIIHVRPVATGAHSIEVIMRECTAAPCFFAFNVYAR